MSVRPILFAAVLALGGCAASIPPVQVTRFHLSIPITPGTIAMDPGVMSLEASTYRAAVAAELARLGFADAGSQMSRYQVSVGIERDTRPAPPRRSPITIGVGGGTGGYGGGGVGLGASFGLGGNKNRDAVFTRMSVQLRDRSTKSVVWEGRAETVATSNAPAAQPGLAADKLAKALFRDFPGESGRTISVP
jgi:Domain of unknown function (DUF4136)